MAISLNIFHLKLPISSKLEKRERERERKFRTIEKQLFFIDYAVLTVKGLNNDTSGETLSFQNRWINCESLTVSVVLRYLHMFHG